jgi:hypothetical protein
LLGFMTSSLTSHSAITTALTTIRTARRDIVPLD